MTKKAEEKAEDKAEKEGAADRAEAPILLASDFSSDSEAAFAWAADASRAFGAPLHVLHVVHDPADAPGVYAEAKHSSLDKLEDVGREMLGEWIQRMTDQRAKAGEAPIPIASSIAVGLPETRILEVAERERARMIVVGGRGQSGLSDILLGSRAERVARNSPIPVMIVRDTTEFASRGSR